MFYELPCHVWHNISVTIIEFGEREMTYDFLLVFVLVFDFLREFEQVALLFVKGIGLEDVVPEVEADFRNEGIVRDDVVFRLGEEIATSKNMLSLK